MALGNAKQAVGEAAAQLVEHQNVVGLGTGSTAACALEALGRRIQTDGLQITGVPTSSAAAVLARRYSIPLVGLDTVSGLDIVLDGADEVDPVGNLIKGRGAAHTQEKVVASFSRRFVVMIDDSKRVNRLGELKPVPVEVLPMAAHPVTEALRGMGARPVLRMGVHKDGPVVTDQGFWVIDAYFQDLRNPQVMSDQLLRLPGVLDHGLFVGMTTDLLVGHTDGTVEHISY